MPPIYDYGHYPYMDVVMKYNDSKFIPSKDTITRMGSKKHKKKRY